MSVAIIGGGISGEAVRRALERRGTATSLLSRSTGFDVLRDDAELALDGVEAVVEITGITTGSRDKATEFFTTSTARIAEGARAAG